MNAIRSPVHCAIPALRAREAGVGLVHDREPAGRDAARALDRRRGVVGRAVVDEHDLELIGGDRLIETGGEDALEEQS